MVSYVISYAESKSDRQICLLRQISEIIKIKCLKNFCDIGRIPVFILKSPIFLGDRYF